MTNFHAARDEAGRFLVRFNVLADVPGKEPGHLVRLPLRVERIDRAGRGARPLPFEVVGVVADGEPLTLAAEVILHPGDYRVTDPHFPARDWRFSLSEREETSIRTYCGHRPKGKKPTYDEWLFAYSVKGDAIAGSTVLFYQPCCRADFTHYDPEEPANTYSLGIYQPLSTARTFLVDEKNLVTVRPGEYLLLNPLQSERPPANHPLPAHYRMLYVNQLGLRSFRETVGLPKEHGAFDFEPRPRKMFPALARAIAQFEDAMRHPDALGARHAMTATCHNLMLVLLREHPNRFQGMGGDTIGLHLPDPRLKRAVDHLHAHLDRPYDAAGLARHVGVSPELLWKLFRTHLQMTPNDYLQGVRVERAKELLKNHDHTLERVAGLVGYKDVRSFRRVFKEHTNKPTRLFRRG